MNDLRREPDARRSSSLDGPGGGTGRRGVARYGGSAFALGTMIALAAACSGVKDSNPQDSPESVATTQEAVIVPTCVTIQEGLSGSSYDSGLQKASPGTNFGNKQENAVGQSQGSLQEFLLYFNLTAVPPNVQITSATLTLEQYATVVEPVNIHMALAPWNPATVTWNSFGQDYSQAAASTFNTVVGLASVTANVQALLQVWINGQAPNDGMLIEQPAGAATFIDASLQTTQAWRPMLTFCYQCPAGFADCNNTPQDGCETPIDTLTNCLACGTQCAPGTQCSTAECDPVNGCELASSPNGTPCNDGNACTQLDICKGGSCIGEDPVVCTAEGPCYVAGACNPATGVCTNPMAPNGTACNDGNLCTVGGTCSTGTCQAGAAKVCTASDQCHAAGTCSQSTGVCSNPAAPDGTACNDGNACTQTDTCLGGTCVGSNPVVCTAAGQCSSAGTCNPATGTCSSPAAPNGTVCNDGNACTLTDTCQGGTCVGSNPVVCTAAGQCDIVGTCNPATGACSNPAAPDGTACNDGNGCTQTDTCLGGTCVGSNPVVCTAAGQCNSAGTCNPATGARSNPTAPNGT
jgi:hypothetical protein